MRTAPPSSPGRCHRRRRRRPEPRTVAGFRVYRNCTGLGSGVLTESFEQLRFLLFIFGGVGAGLGWLVCSGLGWAGLGWAGLGWAGLGWAGWLLGGLDSAGFDRKF